ncbi:GNAT family N-acetyltransferase [Erwiniaceae bacterium BAC15a-03b]|uniref:GNAT family N-acetyltransferase n=1 Tax=Winslowiella arboricola TaxID=2978220 RepID=A0A9J6PHJ4_9GAMM|nr:GNAT family N-acetyltransferase [Winslowiella arboricola]MCU5771605.1 GNAT family N-acetyltransferase [Winslowiella arboricola]MCU5775923.1 GNAT family N-acetyltransferase [Winslowiella arboricola]
MKTVLLNATTLPHYRSELAGLLIDAVASNAPPGYQQRKTYEEAESYFHSLRRDMAKGERLLWIARDAQGVTGSVQLEICQKPDGQNRAEIQKLLVHPRARRQGMAKMLMNALESSAAELQRGLLFLNTRAGSPAEAFYRAQGYHCIGEIPDYASSSDGYYHPAVIYYKKLFSVNQLIRSVAS